MFISIFGEPIDTDFIYRISKVEVKDWYGTPEDRWKVPSIYWFTLYFKDGKRFEVAMMNSKSMVKIEENTPEMWRQLYDESLVLKRDIIGMRDSIIKLLPHMALVIEEHER